MYNPQLETFIRVADAGSFNKAAERSYITPTAVIKQINLLEASLGIKLFERTHRGLIMTKAAYPCTRMQNTLFSIVKILSHVQKMQCRKIRISFGSEVHL